MGGKLVIGLPFYSYEYVGFVGDRPLVSFQRPLNQISSLLQNGSGWAHNFDNASRTPFLRRGSGVARREVWYDDPGSIAEKVGAAQSLGLTLSGCWTGNSLDYGAD